MLAYISGIKPPLACASLYWRPCVFLSFMGRIAEPGEPQAGQCHACVAIRGFSEERDASDLSVSVDAFQHSVHGKRDCVSCHQDITKIPHEKGLERKVGCVQCHTELWAEAQQSGTTEEHARLGVVVRQIESYMGSVHARPSLADQSRTNATCYDCHDAHYIEPIDSSVGSKSRLTSPKSAGSAMQAGMNILLRCTGGKFLPAMPVQRYAAIATPLTTSKTACTFRQAGHHPEVRQRGQP
jgi:hypothetical protein